MVLLVHKREGGTQNDCIFSTTYSWRSFTILHLVIQRGVREMKMLVKSLTNDQVSVKMYESEG
jgi:hypothetical protein